MAVKSAERVLKVFELLAQHPEGLTIKEISETLAFPQSSTSGLIETLFQANYLTVDFSKKYKLGPKLIPLGSIAMNCLDVAAQGLPFLKRLMEEVQETVFMAVLSDSELIYVAKINSNRSIRTTAEPGKSKPLYCTGLGKAFLTFLPIEHREKVLRDLTLKPITSKTITDKTSLKEQLDMFAKIGYAIDDEENEDGLYCLAAPIYGVECTIQAAISVAGPKERMLKNKERIVENLLHTSMGISDSIGYR
ncbi:MULTISPECIES: IclR family transcriptional regulator [Neobacillus]|uniref:IclR family transcriptional regulator n=1 Tax=Neobacillus rhizophilus TaxID=2833579 RepID=A0A942YXU1_9BACI|nr:MULTISPECIES: IclR family transcriptional regulator [Neobacillus]MBS4216359.1 IclR family transcriptional regulator [Neobacillus rhizophilus]MBU8917083.1 IclR family transcriptional regulator [Bacillus sp. FJAT-29953]